EAEHDGRQIGRAVLGPMVTERLAAPLAMVGELHEAAKQAAFTACRAAAQQATHEPSVGDLAGRRHGCLAGCACYIHTVSHTFNQLMKRLYGLAAYTPRPARRPLRAPGRCVGGR